MKARMVSLVLAVICVATGVLGLLPTLLPDGMFRMLPWNSFLADWFVAHEHAVPESLSPPSSPFPSVLFGLLGTFFLGYDRPLYWRMFHTVPDGLHRVHVPHCEPGARTPCLLVRIVTAPLSA